MPRLIFGALLVMVFVIIGKGLGQRGRVLQGGRVSGHAAYGFFFATSMMFVTDNAIVVAICILLAAMIAQSRYEAKFHSAFELAAGALVGTITSLMIFGLSTK